MSTASFVTDFTKKLKNPKVCFMEICIPIIIAVAIILCYIYRAKVVAFFKGQGSDAYSSSSWFRGAKPGLVPGKEDTPDSGPVSVKDVDENVEAKKI